MGDTQFLLEQPYLFHVAAEQPAHISGPAGLATNDENTTQALLQVLYPLRYRGRSDVERACRPFEASLANYCGNG